MNCDFESGQYNLPILCICFEDTSATSVWPVLLLISGAYAFWQKLCNSCFLSSVCIRIAVRDGNSLYNKEIFFGVVVVEIEDI